MRRVLPPIGLIVALIFVSGVRADSVTLPAQRDNTLIESVAGDLSNGAGTSLFSGETLQFGSRRALLRFDLSSLPPGSTVTSVSLSMTMDFTRAGPFPFGLHRVLADWGEGTSASGGGGGDAATPGDATWLHRFFNGTPWTNPGGDYLATPSSTLTIGAGGNYTWSSTPGLVADVQGWLDNPAGNFGWIVIGDETTRSVKRFVSREGGALGPALTVTFTPPPVAATVPIIPAWASPLAFSMLALAGLLALRRRV